MWIFNAIANAVGKNFIGTPNYLFGLLFNRVQADGGVTEAQQCTINELTELQNENLLSSASLVVTPSSYKESKLYSLIPSDGSGDFTFTRATTATRVNSSGLIELVPYNLLSYSEQFDNAIWSKAGGATITANSTTAPDGTLTADTFDTNQTKLLFQNRPALNNTTYTLSVWVKLGTATNLCLIVNNTLSWDTIGGQSFNASNGLNTSTWTRISFTFTTPTLPVNAVNIHLGGNAQGGLVQSSGTVFIWGVQLNEGTSALTYQKTETRLNIPRIDYSLGGCPNILLEPQRTNLALQSSSFDNASWIKSNLTVTPNFAISPSGVQDADLLDDGTVATNTHWLFQFTTLSNSTTYTISFYAKYVSRKYMTVNLFNGSTSQYVDYDIQNGTILGSTGDVTASINSVGNGWYKINYTRTTVASGVPNFRIGLADDTGNEVYTGSNKQVLIWGAQIEAGAYATSYIPTTTASVTRNQDICTKTNASAYIGQTEGTIYIEFDNLLQSSYGNESVLTLYGSANDQIFIRKESGTNGYTIRLRANSVNAFTFTGVNVLNGRNKIAITYKSGANIVYLNGVEIGNSAATWAFITNITDVNLGHNNAAAVGFNRVYALGLWKEITSAAQLAQLTTL